MNGKSPFRKVPLVFGRDVALGKRTMVKIAREFGGADAERFTFCQREVEKPRIVGFEPDYAAFF